MYTKKKSNIQEKKKLPVPLFKMRSWQKCEYTRCRNQNLSATLQCQMGPFLFQCIYDPFVLYIILWLTFKRIMKKTWVKNLKWLNIIYVQVQLYMRLRITSSVFTGCQWTYISTYLIIHLILKQKTWYLESWIWLEVCIISLKLKNGIAPMVYDISRHCGLCWSDKQYPWQLDHWLGWEAWIWCST